MTKNKIKVSETLNDFLFSQIENDPEFIEFVENYEIPDYITSNISRTLRPYQELALKHFIYLFEKDPSLAKHLLFNMATGTGKTLLAKASANLLPPPSLDEQIAITKLHSLNTLCTQIITERPYRAPHHSASLAALLGGGPNLIPGEISLAHLGILHLDELLEFPRDRIEALRQPLESHSITLSRLGRHISYPADFMLIATTNPCP